MPVVELRFPAGRYHATPWGRHVNEGAPEWPPSPFRLARALADVWFRRPPAGLSHESLRGALTLLSGVCRFSLPAGVQATIKTYLPQYKAASRQPVLDSFVALDADATVYMELPRAAPLEDVRALDALLQKLDYLGRSESWVAACIRDCLPTDREWNCLPGTVASDTEERASVNLLLSPEKYADRAFHPCRTVKAGKSRRECRLSWFEALCLSTGELSSDGWNRHPLMTTMSYTLENRDETASRTLNPMSIHCVTYAVHGPVLPKVTQTLPFAKRVRAILMGIHKKIMNGDAGQVSSLFSGKDIEGKPLQGHRHARFWPLDLDGDGRIDHIRIHAAQSFDENEQRALFALRRVWTPGRAEDLALTLVHALDQAPVKLAPRFVSLTPLVLQRHWRKGRGSYGHWLCQEVRRACGHAGLPAPCGITPLTERSDNVRWNAFIRAQSGQAAPAAYGFRLEFEEPVAGPFALGALAHYGLGLFVAE